MRKYLATLLLLSVSAQVQAQDIQPFVGSWKVSFAGEKGTAQARLVIAANGGGSWQTSSKKKSDPCIGMEVPIALQDVGAEKATVLLKFSEKLAGCVDSRIKLQKTDADHMSGTRGDKELTVVRD